jgi:hypothetical protein
MSIRARRKMLLAAVAALSLSVGACSKRDDAGKPAGVPPLDPGAAPAAPAPPPLPPPPPPVAVAPAAPAAAAPPAAGELAAGSITGTIVLTGPAAKSRPKSGTLYLVARRISDNPNARGTLIAVKKLPATTFPLAFSLTAADMPFQNGPFDGELTLTARIDQDGDPLTHEKGDVFGALPKVIVGAHGVKLALDQVQKETESLAGGGPMMGGTMGGGMGAPAAPATDGTLPPGHPAVE